MKYLSVCSGIEAATVAWHPLGWEPVGFSEIEPFPSAVLAHHYPNVTNFGDMTKYREWNIGTDRLDLLVGGTPCQSFSVAGLRKGLEDPRGNLALVYCGMLDHFRPQWFVWENVPGVLSSSGGRDFTCFLDALEELGYICDIEILDAQFHGVAQRRRRVFVCGQHRDDLLSKRTHSSVLTISQCLVEILHGIFAEKFNQSGKGRKKSESVAPSKDGAIRRMKLFGLAGEQNNWQRLLWNLEGGFLKYREELNQLDAILGGSEADYTQEDLWLDSETESQYMNTEMSWKKDLEEVYQVMKSFITSTSTSSITQTQIYTSFQAVLTIGKVICLSSISSPAYWSAASSVLIALQEFINYARQASSELSENMDRVYNWDYLIRQAERLCHIIGNTSVRNFGEIFPVSQSLRRDTAPCREKRKVTPTLSSSGTGVSRVGFNCEDEWFIEQPFNVANCLTQRMHKGINTTVDEGQTPVICHGTQDTCVSDIAFAMGTNNGGENVLMQSKQKPLDPYLGGEVTISIDASYAKGCGGTSAAERPVVASGMAVRRLTPVECERLQGFPDSYTNIPWRKKEESPDGPRYKALGNSMAVPCMHWIGKRINEHSRLL